MKKNVKLWLTIIIVTTGLLVASCAKTAQQVSEPKQTLSKTERLEIYQDLVRLQDQERERSPDFDTDASYEAISRRYSISKAEVRDILVEALEKDWPKPALPELVRKRAEIIADYKSFTTDEPDEIQEFTDRVNASSMEQLEAFEEQRDKLLGTWDIFEDPN